MKNFMTAAALIALASTLSVGSQAQVLKVGSTVSGQPMSGLNQQTKEWEGIAVEMITAMTKDAGLQIEFQPMVFADLQPALTSKKIDIIASGYGITAEREKVVDFTWSYGSYRDLLVIPIGDTKNYKMLADFKGMSIATPKGSAYVNALKEAGANVVLVNTPPETLAELEAGRVAGVVDNGLQLVYRMKGGAHTGLKIVDTYEPILVGRLAFAVQKGNADLLGKLNASLARLQANGTAKSIANKWGLN